MRKKKHNTKSQYPWYLWMKQQNYAAIENVNRLVIYFMMCSWKTMLETANAFSFSFLDLNIKVIGSDIHTSVYDKRDDFGFPIVNFPWLSGDVPRLPSYGVKISQLVRFARCSTCISDFHSKNLQISSKLLTQVYRYHKLRKTFGKFFRSYSDLFI